MRSGGAAGLGQVPKAGVEGSRALVKGQAGLGLPPGVGLGVRCFPALGLGIPICKVGNRIRAPPPGSGAASGTS